MYIISLSMLACVIVMIETSNLRPTLFAELLGHMQSRNLHC